MIIVGLAPEQKLSALEQKHSHSRKKDAREAQHREVLPATNAAEPIAPVSWPLIDKTDSAKYNWGAQGLLVGRGAPLHDGVAPGPRGTCASTTPSRALDLVMAASTAGPAPRTPLLLPTPLDAITCGASLRTRHQLAVHARVRPRRLLGPVTTSPLCPATTLTSLATTCSHPASTH